MTLSEDLLQKNMNQPFPPKFGQRIAIVTGHSNGKNENDFGSSETCKIFCENVRKTYANVSYHRALDISSLERIVKEKPALVVLCCKHIIDPNTKEKIWLSDFFQSKGLIFTGSTRKALEIASNKSTSKTIVQNANIATARYFLTSHDQYRSEDRLPLSLPVFIKSLDGSHGSGSHEHLIARDFSTFSRKVSKLTSKQGGKVLVEEFLSGREFTVAVFNDATTGRRWTLPMEILPLRNQNGDPGLKPHDRNCDLKQFRRVNDPILDALKSIASQAFTVLGARDFARVDIKLDGSGIPNFIEIDLMPEMTPDSGHFANACSFKEKGGSVNGSYSGMSYAQVANKIIEIGLNRFESENRP